ncbi:nuclear transport factor 2 family protein [Streptomyces sp. NPDC057376]|uniref:nuclear transport factor 2 family protein n=1 Tax=Streptomyces sp. NPDC057376 TaxID=3346110 RepID=UPI003626FD1F
MTDVQVEDLSEVLPALWNLLGDYARAIDSRDTATVPRLFGGTGTLALPDRDITGGRELAEFTQQAPGGVHVQGVPTVRRGSDGTLHVTSNFVFVNASTYALSSGEYRDEVRQGEDGLFFARRAVTIKVRTSDEPPSE